MTPLALSALVAALLVGIALAVAALRDPLAATVVFAAYSLGMALVWVTLGAPDVALTEAAVGAGVTTSLFLLALAGTERTAGAAFVRRVRPSSVAAAGAVGAALVATVPALPAAGDPLAPGFRGVSAHYLAHAHADFGVENVVTAILAGYRGFDTFGEVAVVFGAGVAVLVVFHREASDP